MPGILQWDEPRIFAFFFVLTRVMSLVVFLPILGERSVPPMVKIFFGVTLSFVAFPVLWAQGARISPDIVSSPGRTLWTICCDAAFGMALGLVARWVFDAVQMGAHYAGTTIGYSIATVFDPHSESQTIALAEIQYLLAAMLFLSMNGHHLYLQAILKSFQIVPLEGANLLAHGDSVMRYLIDMSGEILALGLKFAGPVLAVILIINMTFGIMTRAVPQMNVMASSFTANILVGLVIVMLTLPGFVNMVNGAFDSYGPELFRFMRLFGG